jgi:hypothetical protein
MHIKIRLRKSVIRYWAVIKAAGFPFSPRRLALCSTLCFSVAGCATYQAKVATARDSMRRGQAAQAAKELEPLASKEDRDQLVYMLDYATVLQQANRYKDSAKVFDRAEKMADIQDYHSISKIASSLVLNEEMIQYKGDDYEKVLINAVNAVNYLETGELDDALVEVRKLNSKLYKFKYEAKRDYEQNPFAFYLSAVIWEADRKYDDAYIAYKSAFELVPDYAPLREDLIRAAIRAQRPEDVEMWRKKFPEVQIKPEWRDRNMGEIVLVYMQGWGPRKHPRPEEPRFPHLVPVSSEVQSAKLVIDNQKVSAQTNRIFSVQQVAIKTLNDDYARLVATRVAGVATKAVLADQIGQKNKLLGAVAWVAMNVADRADLRQWSTLPETFQIARLPIKPGKYKVKVVGLDSGGNETTDQMPDREVEVKPGKKTFISWRSVR